VPSFDFSARTTLRNDLGGENERFQQVAWRKAAPYTSQIGPHTTALTSIPVALDAARLEERGFPSLERASALELPQRRQKVFHLPIANELLGRLHLANPFAEECDGWF